jgi:hypothetical protein
MIEGRIAEEKECLDNTPIQTVRNHAHELAAEAHDLMAFTDMRVDRALGSQPSTCSEGKCNEEPEPDSDIEDIRSNLVCIRRCIESIRSQIERI